LIPNAGQAHPETGVCLLVSANAPALLLTRILRELTAETAKIAEGNEHVDKH
jgi:hypothetical protein